MIPMKYALVLGATMMLSACATQKISDYAQNQPRFDVVKFFSGKTEAWGMFQKRNGEVVKRFHVNMEGHEENGKLVLDEHFTYSDGTKQSRVWTLTPQPDGSWRGIAADVIGQAIGHTAGNTLHWRYTVKLPVDKTTYNVQFDDWMYLVDEHTMINRARVTKFGFEVGQVTLFFRHPA